MQYQLSEDIRNNTRPHIIINGRTYYQIPNARDYYLSEDDHVYSTVRHKELSVNRCVSTGYMQVTINAHTQPLQRLKYETFIGPIPNGKTVNHIDWNTRNNSLNNLEPLSHRENCNKQRRHETVNELPEGSIELEDVVYRTPRNVYHFHIHYHNRTIYERFDTCYKRIHPTPQGQVRINGITVLLNKLIQLIEDIIDHQQPNSNQQY